MRIKKYIKLYDVYITNELPRQHYYNLSENYPNCAVRS